MSDSIDDILDFCENSGEDSPQQIEIYTKFINAAPLESADRESLRKERGFSDNVIDLMRFKSACSANRDIIEDLKKEYSEEALLDAGLLEATERGINPCSQLLGVYKNDKFVNNIIIPYTNANDDIFYIRPHKFGLPNKGINVYCPVRHLETNTWIITESEFKAAAAVQFGFPALGLPGIHSFAVKHFFRLQSFIESMPQIQNIIIMFDNEIKHNRQFKNFKQNVLKQWDTQWRSYQLCEKLYQALNIKSVKIATLPEEWMEEGKIDIDGALAQGRTKDQFRAVVYNSLFPDKYLAGLPETAQKIIMHRVYREKTRNAIPVEKDNNRYVMKKRGKATRDEPEPEIHYIPVSNFVMKINKVLIEGDTHIREVIFYGQDGSISKPHIMEPDAMQLRDFRTWIAGCGNYVFEGSQEDLIKIWNLEFALCDSRKIHRPEEIGYLRRHDPPIWLFGNCLIKKDETILYPSEDGQDEGVIWDGLEGYLPRSIKESSAREKVDPGSKMPKINLDPNVDFGLAELKQVAKDLEKVYTNKSIKLGLGWVVACLLSKEISDKMSCFPLLFINGKRESGKTTLGNWLMAFLGLNEFSGENIEDSTIPGVARNLAWYSSLPFWLDEYRSSAKIMGRYDGFLRNVYQRQSGSKGTLNKTVRSLPVNGCLLISGEETPEDNALFSRCIIISLADNKERKTDKEISSLFNKIEDLRHKNLLSRLILEVLKRKDKIIDTVLANIDGWKKQIQERGVGERVAINFAITAVCYDTIFLSGESLSDKKEFIRWVLQEAHLSEKQKEAQHVLYQFFEGIVSKQKDLEDFYTVFTDEAGNKRIALHYPTFYKEWAMDEKRMGKETFRRTSILDYMRSEKYFVGDNKTRRVNGKTMRCLILSLEDADSPPFDLLTFANGFETSVTSSDADNADSELPF